MSSGSGSGDPSSNPGEGENIYNLSLVFWAIFHTFVLVQICNVLCAYTQETLVSPAIRIKLRMVQSESICHLVVSFGESCHIPLSS